MDVKLDYDTAQMKHCLARVQLGPPLLHYTFYFWNFKFD